MLFQDLLHADTDVHAAITNNGQVYSLILFELIRQKTILQPTITREKGFDRETYRAEKIDNYLRAVGRLAL